MEAKDQVIVRLFELLDALGCQQKTIAARMGVTKGAVSLWARGLKPLPPRHEATLHALLDEYWELDLARLRDQISQPYSRRARAAQLQHEEDVDAALKHYRSATYQLAEHLAPGSGLRDLYAQADTLVHAIAAMPGGGAKTWTFRDRQRLRDAARDLTTILDLIHLVEPQEKFQADWQAFFKTPLRGRGS
jgi:transcriptional regulator with XRE-family HTH domain